MGIARSEVLLLFLFWSSLSVSVVALVGVGVGVLVGVGVQAVKGKETKTLNQAIPGQTTLHLEWAPQCLFAGNGKPQMHGLNMSTTS